MSAVPSPTLEGTGFPREQRQPPLPWPSVYSPRLAAGHEGPGTCPMLPSPGLPTAEQRCCLSCPGALSTVGAGHLLAYAGVEPRYWGLKPSSPPLSGSDRVREKCSIFCPRSEWPERPVLSCRLTACSSQRPASPALSVKGYARRLPSLGILGYLYIICIGL